MKTSLAAVALLAALALAGCAPTAQETAPTPTASDACAGVEVVVDFGVLDAPSVNACVDAGPAVDAVADADITTEGTVEWGDQIVCRVDRSSRRERDRRGRRRGALRRGVPVNARSDRLLGALGEAHRRRRVGVRAGRPQHPPA